MEYTQISKEVFNINVQLLLLASFNFEQLTGKDLLPVKEGSIDDSIITKIGDFSKTLNKAVFWVKNDKSRKNYNEYLKECMQKTYNGYFICNAKADKHVKHLLVLPKENFFLPAWGVKDKQSFELLENVCKCKDFQNMFIYILKLLGDGQDLNSKEVPYIPLITSYNELSLTGEEIERIESFSN